MNKLNEIGLTLGEAYIEQKDVEIRLSHQRQDLDARKLYLTPSDGWPGKNESERKVAAEKTFAADGAEAR